MKTIWNPKARPQPLSAVADVSPAWDRAMHNRDQPMTREDYLTMVSYHRLAFTNIKQGTASEQSWGCLALASNIALVLAEMGYGEEYLALIQCAQDALMRAKERGEKAGSWRLDGSGMALLAEALDVLDAQLEVAPRGKITEARDVILQRMAEHEVLEMSRAAA